MFDQISQAAQRMAKTVNLYEAKTHLSKLVDRAAAGEEIIIAKAGRPRAKLAPLPKATKPRRPAGALKLSRIAKDFDAPLPEALLSDFEGRGS
jgi:prevent-host-death family protein